MHSAADGDGFEILHYYRTLPRGGMQLLSYWFPGGTLVELLSISRTSGLFDSRSRIHGQHMKHTCQKPRVKTEKNDVKDVKVVSKTEESMWMLS